MQTIQNIPWKFSKLKKAHLSLQVNQIVPIGLSFRMAVSSTDLNHHHHHRHHHHHFFSFSHQSNQKKFYLHNAEKNRPNQQMFSMVVEKQNIGAVDILKRTKAEIDAEGKFNFNYVLFWRWSCCEFTLCMGISLFPVYLCLAFYVFKAYFLVFYVVYK